MPLAPGAGVRRLAWRLLDRWIRWRFPDVAAISCQELAAVLAGGRPVPVLIDARGEEEFTVSHLAGALRLPTVVAIEAEGIEPGQAIVVYCSVGYRSALLARSLQQAGFRDVRNLEGSLFRWANLALPLEGTNPAQRRVHPFHPCWGLLLEPPNPNRNHTQGTGDPYRGGTGRDSYCDGMESAPSMPDPTGPLLEEILVPLLNDYAESFDRGLLLLDHCPETVMAAAEQADLRERLDEARRSLAAARALRAAAPKPMGLAMETITPWHRLVVEVWSLSARLRAAGIRP